MTHLRTKDTVKLLEIDANFIADIPRLNKWCFINGDINWIDYGAEYARFIDAETIEIVVFVNQHDCDPSFDCKYVLYKHEMSFDDILSDRQLKDALLYADTFYPDKRDPRSFMFAMSALINYGGYGYDLYKYVGNNAYKLFKQAHIKPFS